MSEFFPEIPRIYTAFAEWLACIVYISILKRRLNGWRFFAFIGGVFILQAVFLVVTRDLPIVFWVPSMLVAVGMMFLLIYICCDITL
ncbi:hypothetical protein [Bacillus sp. JCM 19034]|uniref:hypothetical protein n=1 Tax=Bacillus sp. JCM 19034 TaxID=1481928 RepID=UPI000B0D30F2|nr:hypothetical protein [Bacillus sp. JCM 19034]